MSSFCNPETDICSICIVNYNADVVTANDYYPFGMVMPGRKYSQTNSNYRYGFNGKENDNEVKGEGGQQDYGMRIYDPRLGKFLSVDPLMKSYPYYTPYQFAGNSPIAFADLDGLERIYYIYYIDNSTGKPVLQSVVTQTRKASAWDDWKTAFRETYVNATTDYSKRTQYNGDLIIDCSEVYVLQTGIAFKEFSSFDELKTTTSDAINRAAEAAIDMMVLKLMYGEAAFEYFTSHTPYYEQMQREDADYNPGDETLNKYHSETGTRLYPRYDGIKITKTASKNITVSGKE